MRRAVPQLGRVLRNQLFADAIVVKSTTKEGQDDAQATDHLATAERLSAALGRHREARRRQQAATKPISASSPSSSTAAFGSATTKAPFVDVMRSVGQSTLLVEQGPLDSYTWLDTAGEETAPGWARRPWSPHGTAVRRDDAETHTAMKADGNAHASAAHERREVGEFVDEEEDLVGLAPMAAADTTVAEVLEGVADLWDGSPASARLRWLLATPLGRRVAVEYLAPTPLLCADGAHGQDGEEGAEGTEAVVEQGSRSDTAVAAMMRRYDGLGLRPRGVSSSWRQRRRRPASLARGAGPAWAAQTASLDGLYPSRNSSGSATRSDDYATLRRLFADRLVTSPQQQMASDLGTAARRPASALSSSSSAAAVPRVSCLGNPTLAGCTAPGTNTTFVAQKVRTAFSNQRKSLWKQQVKKMISGDGAATFMGPLKGLQQPSSEFTHTHTDHSALGVRATTATERASETHAAGARTGNPATFARVLSASEKAAGLASPTASPASSASGIGATGPSSELLPDVLFSERFLVLCAEMGIGSPRYAYVSKALLRKMHPGSLDGKVTPEERDDETRTAAAVDDHSASARSSAATWDLATVRLEAEKLSREYDAHVAQLYEGRDPQEAAEAQRRYDAALLEEELCAVYNRLIEFRTQLPTLRRLADALST